MAYTVRDALRFVYPLIWQHGATRAVWANNFLVMTNHALNMIYNYNWYIWSWQHTKDLFIIPNEDQLALRLVTSKPINTIDKFYTSNWTDIEQEFKPCKCTFDLPDVVCWSSCECDVPCNPLKLTKIRPQNNLCSWEYKIAWSEIAWQWWLQGRIIQVLLEKKVKQLWVSYWKWPVHVKSFDDIIPLPDNFMTAFAYFIAGMIVPMYWTMMQQQDLTFTSIARKQLDELKMADNDFPPKVEFDNTYPISEPKPY